MNQVANSRAKADLLPMDGGRSAGCNPLVTGMYVLFPIVRDSRVVDK